MCPYVTQVAKTSAFSKKKKERKRGIHRKQCKGVSNRLHLKSLLGHRFCTLGSWNSYLPKISCNLSRAPWKNQKPWNDMEGQMQTAREQKEPLFLVSGSIWRSDSAGKGQTGSPSVSSFTSSSSSPPTLLLPGVCSRTADALGPCLGQ